MGLETYRVFRWVTRDDGEDDLVHVGDYLAERPKDAVKQAADHDEVVGEHRYEAHVARNASVFDIRNRDERFTDSVVQQNTDELLRV